MTTRSAISYYDGDTFPRIRLEHMDAGLPRDLTNIATWVDVWRGGAFLVRRPGMILSPKSGGIAEYFLRGAETDFDGSGGDLILFPFLLVPYAANDTKATNLLVNPGFDTFTGVNPNRLPSSWTLVGTQGSEIFDGYANELTRPAVTFDAGSFWLAEPGVTPATHLEQTVAQAVSAGDWVTFGCWVRAGNASSSPAAENDDASVMVTTTGDVDYAVTRYAAEQDWNFMVAERQVTASRADITARLRYKGYNSGSVGMRFDESCLFVGRYRRLPIRPINVKVHPRKRVAKTGGNALAGYGSFELDSDANGVPDAWTISTLSGNGATLSLDANPANVAEGSRSLKIVGAPAASSLRLLHFKRLRFRAGEQWRFSVKYKTSGTLTGAAPNVLLLAEPFTNGAAYRYQSSAGTMNQTQPTFATVTATATLPYDVSGLECRINVGTMNGTLWIDDAQLTRL